MLERRAGTMFRVSLWRGRMTLELTGCRKLLHTPRPFQHRNPGCEEIQDPARLLFQGSDTAAQTGQPPFCPGGVYGPLQFLALFQPLETVSAFVPIHDALSNVVSSIHRNECPTPDWLGLSRFGDGKEHNAIHSSITNDLEPLFDRLGILPAKESFNPIETHAQLPSEFLQFG